MADNNTYEPENDTNLVTDLTQNDTYTPENDLNLQQSLVSTPIFATSTANATATGDTLNLAGGTATLETTTASASGTGETDIFLTTGLFTTRRANASASGETISVSGQSTLDTTTANASATGGTSNLQDTGFATNTANATATGGQNLELVIPPIGTTTATATATGGQTQFQVLGNDNQITVLIDGERIDTYTNIEVKKRLNEVDTFAFEAFISDSNDRALINEGNIVKIIEDYDQLLFKGKLTEVEYKSNFRAKCEGDGMVTKLLNRKTDRETFSNTAGDDIVKSVVDNTYINYGDIEAAPQVSVRFDHDNEARAVAGVANATGYDWFVDQDPADDWETDRLNFVEDAGRDTSQQTLEIGSDASLVERNKDEGFVANDITLLGRGDGINQLEAEVFACVTAFTDTTQIIDENESASFTVEDTSQLGSTGDNLLVRVGTEVMDVDITDGTTLSINSRGLDDYNGDATEQIKHYNGIRVWRLENVTQGIGRFTPESRDTAENGSSVESKGVKQQRDTDKTIVDLSTLEKTADLELKNRFEDVFRIQTKLSDPSDVKRLRLGDTVTVKDLTAMDVDNEFDIVGMDIMRNSSDEGTVLHMANRPRRLTERLSEIESDRDTLNAHMQGATNFNGEHFEDNVDESNPLTNKVFVPDDVVKINKFELTFTRESFRGYIKQDSSTASDGMDIWNLLLDDSKDELINQGDGETVTFNVNSGNEHQMSKIKFSVNPPIGELDPYDIEIIAGGATVYEETNVNGPREDSVIREFDFDSGDTIDVEIFNAGSDDYTYTVSLEVVGDSGHTHKALSDPNQYGIFSPSSEENIDVDVVVDGSNVTTISNLSVGDEVSAPIDIKNNLSDPITGTYHDIKLVPSPSDNIGDGRSRLSADITQKIFIESTL